MLYSDVKRPYTQIRKINGWVLNNDYCSLCDDIDFSIVKGKLISKIPNGPGGANGISLWNLPDEIDDFKKYFSEHNDIIVEEYIEQHPLLSALHKESVNTIRLVTFSHNNEISVLSMIIRMGVGNNYVDNAHFGGIFCGIDNNGKLKKYAYNNRGDKFECHPTSKITFEGYVIPNINECIMTVKTIAMRLSNTNKLLHWDMVIDKDGNPVFVEVNMAMGELDFHQMTNGPLFGDMTKDVIEEVFQQKSKRIIQKIYT